MVSSLCIANVPKHQLSWVSLQSWGIQWRMDQVITLRLIYLSFSLQAKPKFPLVVLREEFKFLDCPWLFHSRHRIQLNLGNGNNKEKNDSVRDTDEAKLSQKAIWVSGGNHSISKKEIWASGRNYSYRGLSPWGHRIQSILGMEHVMLKRSPLRTRELSLGTECVIYTAISVLYFWHACICVTLTAIHDSSTYAPPVHLYRETTTFFYDQKTAEMD